MQPRGSIAAIIFSLLSAGTANALEAFGFVSGQSPQKVEATANGLGLGVARWFGKTLLVQGQDAQAHSYMFNFCNERLYEITQNFPVNFEKMTGFVDQTIQSYGQPVLVSAAGGMSASGFARPLNLYWKIGARDYLRVMQLEHSYALIYATENACAKVPS